MNVTAELVQMLMAHPDVSDVLGDRFYPKKLPDNPTYPASVYHVISNDHTYSHDGNSNLKTLRIQFSQWGESYEQVNGASDAVKMALDDFTGILGDVEIERVAIGNELDAYDENAHLYAYHIDFLISYKDLKEVD